MIYLPVYKYESNKVIFQKIMMETIFGKGRMYGRSYVRTAVLLLAPLENCTVPKFRLRRYKNIKKKIIIIIIIKNIPNLKQKNIST